jgi:hypothetical protein
MSVILSDARRSAATKRESKNPEDFSFIHAASGSSRKPPSALSTVPHMISQAQPFRTVKLFLRHHSSLGQAEP